MRITTDVTLYNAKTLIKELGLKDGMVVRGKVDGFVDGKAIVNIGGKSVVADSFVPLSIGETIFLKLEKQYGNKLIFRLITRANVGKLVGGSIDFLSLLLRESWKINRETLAFWLNFQKEMGLSLKELLWLSLWTKGLGLPVNWEMAKIAMLFYHKSREIDRFAKHLSHSSPKEFLELIKDTDMEEVLYWMIKFNHMHNGYKFFVVPFGEDKRFSWIFVKEREKERGQEEQSPKSAVIWVDMPRIGKIGILLTLSGSSVNIVFSSQSKDWRSVIERHRKRLENYLESVGFALAKLGFIDSGSGVGTAYFYGIDMEV